MPETFQELDNFVLQHTKTGRRSRSWIEIKNGNTVKLQMFIRISGRCFPGTKLLFPVLDYASVESDGSKAGGMLFVQSVFRILRNYTQDVKAVYFENVLNHDLERVYDKLPELTKIHGPAPCYYKVFKD